MGKPAARVGDMHMCPMVTPGTPPIPHVGGPITTPGAPTVLIGGMPAATLGSMCTCVGPPDSIVIGSTGVLLCGKPAARMGDMTAHGGTIVVGCPTVLIGEISPSGGMAPQVLSNIKMLNGPASKTAQQKVALEKAAEEGAAFCEECEIIEQENPESEEEKEITKEDEKVVASLVSGIPPELIEESGTMDAVSMVPLANSANQEYDPIELITASEAEETVRGTNKTEFFDSVEGANDTIKEKLWNDFINEDWASMENTINSNTFIDEDGSEQLINYGWPPNEGFTSKEEIILSKETEINRLDGPNPKKDRGTFASPMNTSFGDRALKEKDKSRPSYDYKLLDDVSVTAGPAIPWFNQKGMGTQYKFKEEFLELLKSEQINLI